MRIKSGFTEGLGLVARIAPACGVLFRRLVTIVLKEESYARKLAGKAERLPFAARKIKNVGGHEGVNSILASKRQPGLDSQESHLIAMIYATRWCGQGPNQGPPARVQSLQPPADDRLNFASRVPWAKKGAMRPDGARRKKKKVGEARPHGRAAEQG